MAPRTSKLKTKGRTGGSKIWLIIYSDWITTLTLFFILLFYTAMVAAMKNLSPDEVNEMAETITNSATRTKSPATEKAKRENNDVMKTEVADGKVLGEYGEVTSTRKELKITLPEAVLFDAGKAELKESAKPVLATVGNLVAKYPGRVVVEGHTCDLPIHQPIPPGMARWEVAQSRSKGLGPYTSNWELSAARALQVIACLTKEKILPPERLVASACGPSDPVCRNDTEEHRAKNRRIVIKVQLHGNE